MATAQQLDPSYLGVRDTLKNQFKVTDERIGYDPKSGYVTIDGQNIFKPPTNVQGTTYAPQSVFNSAAGTINALNRQYDLQNQVLNPQQNTNPYDQRFNDLLDQLTQRVQTPAQINPYESAQYEAAQAQMQRQAQQSTRQAQEALGGAGLGRSSVLSDRAQRIQNDANEYLETQIVPQIVSQIQAQQQQELNNLMNILGAIGQQQSLYDNRTQNQFGNQFDVLNFLTGRQDRAQNIQREDEAIAREMQQLSEEKAYRSQRDTEEDRRWWADYNRRGEEFAQQMGYNWAQLSQREKERLADEAYRQQSLNLERQSLALQQEQNRYRDQFNQGMQIFQSTGSMPDYMRNFGVNVDGLNNQAMQEEIIALYDDLTNKRTTPENALKIIDMARKTKAKSPELLKQLEETIYMYDPSLKGNQSDNKNILSFNPKKPIEDAKKFTTAVPEFLDSQGQMYKEFFNSISWDALRDALKTPFN